MRFELEEILTIVDKVKQAELELFEYKDEDVKLKIRGKRSVVSAVVPAVSVPSAVMKEAMEGKRETVVSVKAENTAQENVVIPKNVQGEEAVSTGVCVESPMVGTFYAAPSQDAEPFVKVGDHVKKGQTVGIVEAMKLMNELESDYCGTVKQILVSNGEMVEYGQPLFIVEEQN